MNWLHVDECSPKEGTDHVLVYTPHNKEIEFRIMPLFMFDKNSMNWTHWAYLTPPDIKTEE